MSVRTVTILMDQRERKPLPIEPFLRGCEGGQVVRVNVEPTTLEIADYAVAEGVEADVYVLGRKAVIETKRSILELAENVTKKRDNFRKLLRKMRENFDHPLLIVEGGLDTLYKQPYKHQLPRMGIEPKHVIERFVTDLREGGVPFALLPTRTVHQRKCLADFVVRFLVL